MSLVILFGGALPAVQTKFVEPILDRVSSTLSVAMDLQISGISDEYSDFTLESIVDYHIGEQGKMDQYPAIEIIPENSPAEEFTAYSVMSSHDIKIRVWATDDNVTRLQRRIWRYQRAITEILKSDHTLGGYVSLIRFAGHTYEPMNQTEYGAYIYGGSVNVVIDNEETTR